MSTQGSLLVPILVSVLNVFAGLAINNASDKIKLPFSGSVLVGLAILCTVLYVLLSEPPRSAQTQPRVLNWIWFSGLPAIGGAVLFLYALPKSQEVSSNFALIVGYTSLVLFVAGVILPPSLVIWQRWKPSNRPMNQGNSATLPNQHPLFPQSAIPQNPDTSLPESFSRPLSSVEAEANQAMRLTPEILQELVELLEPHMRNERQRRVCLRLAVGDLPVLHDLEWSGAAATFIPDMVDRLVDYGEISPGKPALWALLEYVRSKYGPQKQRNIDILWARIYKCQ
ncbi:MAG: hypothetical protein HC833_13385 [Leptolyngbyaceae cyanobacterium RM1_406_9]|nr:hypothetical protein [Leptolyngbyaceae cyanobacterium SM1_4_3]NJO74659.1 hypothetical protein [Leptolyngbyaceae cyanobacterium RM1_406_9]